MASFDDHSQSQASTGKRRHHSVSPFYLYCKRFVEECKTNGRHFRSEKQGFEAAALKWNTLSAMEKKDWRQKYREERDQLNEGNRLTLRMRNGDRGDPNCDPSILGVLKDFSLKREHDIKALKNCWDWKYAENKNDIGTEHFLVVSASMGHSKDAGLNDLAVIEFSLARGIINEYHVSFVTILPGGLTKARYEAVHHVLTWPGRIQRQLGDTTANFFAAQDQMADVFNALTFVDRADGGIRNWAPSSQLSLAKDLANVSDLRDALKSWFSLPSLDTNSVPSTTSSEGKQDCLDSAGEDVRRMLQEFEFLHE